VGVVRARYLPCGVASKTTRRVVGEDCCFWGHFIAVTEVSGLSHPSTHSRTLTNATQRNATHYHTRRLVGGIVDFIGVHFPQHPVASQPWSLVPGPWSLVPGPWSLVPDLPRSRKIGFTLTSTELFHYMLSRNPRHNQECSQLHRRRWHCQHVPLAPHGGTSDISQFRFRFNDKL
jgi:hypothetical protein